MKLISKLAVASAVFALAFVSFANAQTMRISIPFGFSAGEKVLPAGEYRVELNRLSHRIALSHVDGTEGCYLPVKAFTGSGAPEQGSLVFNQYGDRYFLSQVNARGAGMGASVFSDRAEREIARTQARVRKVVTPASSM